MELTRSIPARAIVKPWTENAGENILHIVLQQGDITVELTTIGAAITAIRTPDKNNNRKNIVAGFSNLAAYRENKDYFGAIVGRYANRIAGGKFSLEGKVYQLSINDDNNHLHGGSGGFSHKVWTLVETRADEQACSALFSYTSADGEEGYPGNLTVTVKYVLDHKNRLHILYHATTDKATPVNLTNHTYFNLTGFEDSTILQHHLQVYGDQYTKKGAGNTTTGEIASVRGTALDFTFPKKIGQDISGFPGDMGYDHSVIIHRHKGEDIVKAAVLGEQRTGRRVNVYTSMPAMQVYTGNYWDGTITGEQGYVYRQHGGVALETQAYPGSVHHAHFPGTILQPGETYASTTIFEFDTIGD